MSRHHRSLGSVLSVSLALCGHAQVVLTPTVIATAGATFVQGGVQLDQTIGEPAYTLLEAGGTSLKQGFQQEEPVRLRVNVRAFLQGPYDDNTGRMRDDLRSAGYLPMVEPYSALGYAQAGSGGERTTAQMLAVTGDDAAVDWVFLELRDPMDNTHVMATRNALVQRDGDVMDVDGGPSVTFDAPPGSYFVSMKHRNHLAVLSMTPVALSFTTTDEVDLTDPSTATYGTEPQHAVGAVRMLWSGDVNGDQLLKYTGPQNDRDPMLVTVGGTTPNNTVPGYRRTDVNMDGTVKYTGPANDRDALLQNVGGTTPNNVRAAQLP
jgi:hypothetical protein